MQGSVYLLARRAALRSSAPVALSAGRAARPTSLSTRALSATVCGGSRSPPRATRTYGLLLAGAASAALVAGPWSRPAHADEAVDYAKVRNELEKLFDDDDNIAPTVLRLAWHASGTYDKESNTGGSDGATMRFEKEAGYAANKGLAIAREKLEPIHKMHPSLSYSDLWTLAGAYAVEYMGGPTIKWRPGRRDKDESQTPPDGRLPEADMGTLRGTVQHLRDIFHRQGFNDQELVALCGAHALGRCHRDASGYVNPWTHSPTTFSNGYFRELLDNVWTLKKWDGPDQFEDPSGELMMLPSDMALLWDREFRRWVEVYAKDEERWFDDFSKAFTKLEENGVTHFGEKKKRGWW